MSKRLEPESVERRDFLGLAGIWAAAVAIFGSVLGMLRLPKPSVLPETGSRIRIGHPEEYPAGTTQTFPEHQVLVVFGHERIGGDVFGVHAPGLHRLEDRNGIHLPLPRFCLQQGRRGGRRSGAADTALASGWPDGRRSARRRHQTRSSPRDLLQRLRVDDAHQRPRDDSRQSEAPAGESAGLLLASRCTHLGSKSFAGGVLEPVPPTSMRPGRSINGRCA